MAQTKQGSRATPEILSRLRMYTKPPLRFDERRPILSVITCKRSSGSTLFEFVHNLRWDKLLHDYTPGNGAGVASQNYTEESSNFPCMSAIRNN